MTITKKWANKLEGIGLILILFSFFIQMIEVGIESDIQEYENYQIHKKLDTIWKIASHDYSMKYPDQGFHFSIDFKGYYDDYKIYSQNHLELSKWEEFVNYNWFTNMRLSLFIIGSIILIIPKFILFKD